MLRFREMRGSRSGAAVQEDEEVWIVGYKGRNSLRGTEGGSDRLERATTCVHTDVLKENVSSGRRARSYECKACT